MQASLPLDLRPYNNRRLFADHFLDDLQRLRAMDEWRQAEGVEKAFQKISHLYVHRAVHFNNHTNEAQTEHDFIRPILDLLWGVDCYQVQVRIPNVDVQRQPDYAFFRTADDRQAAQPRHGTLDYWHEVPCLGDAKRWTASLDKERSATENPSNQISNYLYRSGVRWGILTNGQIWRLYEREKSRAGGIYYEVDLEYLLQHGDAEAFKYFYLFFRREAFLPDSSGVTFVEKVFQGSIDYATEVGDKLKDSVYDALRSLINGLFAHLGNGLDAHDSATMRLVHENCLILLYRLLFILYAEDRRLLPCDEEPYANYSLARLHREINRNLRERQPYLPTMTGHWHHVLNLFQLIDTGFPEGSIPAYNGGLFSPTHYPHLAHTPQSGVQQWQIGDRYLAEAIDLLAYERERWDEAGTRDVDYATLAVQHLGNIYEGLLELQPRVAEEPMIETTEDRKAIFKPIREVPNLRPIRGQPPRKINAGEVYLVTNRGERKATGSYYTPQYIVDYIVEQTVGTLADEAGKKAAELRPAVDREIQQLERRRKDWGKQNKSQASTEGSLHGPDKDSEARTSPIEKQKHRLLEPYLSLKILDPAMGSGHFLVGAADHLSMAMATDPNLLPLEAMNDEDPQVFYKRLVVERCLYGVDINPLAVELAKLSLWLHTVSKDKALSFLDHHLRCGNSLIGARVEDDLAKEPPRFDARGRRTNAESQQLAIGLTDVLTAMHLQHFLGVFRQIMEMPGGTAEIERKKDRVYRDMDTTRDKYRAIANCWLAPFFGVPVIPEQYERAVNTLRGTDADRHALTQEVWFAQAQQVAYEKRFFHWELEFPEIFFNAHGLKPNEERGFETVIGNPPWGADFDITEQQYCSKRFHTGQSFATDSYVLFTEQAIKHLRHSGQIGYITPDTGLRKDDLAYWRDVLFSQTAVQQFVETGPLFPDVRDTWCLITIAARYSIIPEDHKIRHRQISRFVISPEERLNLFAVSQFSRDSIVHQSYWCNRPWQAVGYLASEREQSIITRIGNVSVRLGDLRDKFSISRGEEGSKFKIHSMASATWRLVLPEYVERHSIEEGVPIASDFLAAGKVAGFYSHPKIWVIRIQKLRWRQRLVAAYDERKTSGAMKTLQVIVSTNDDLDPLKFLCSLICSKLVNFGCINSLVDDMNQTYLENLPIRRITFTTPPDERARLVEEGKRLYHQMIEGMGKQR